MTHTRGRWLLGCCLVAVLAGCKPAAPPDASGTAPPSGVANAPSASAPPPTAAASPAVKQGTPESYCAVVIQVNTQYGTLIDKHFVPATQWTQAQRTGIVTFALAHRDEFLAATPPELRPDIELELQWYQSIADHGYSWTDAPYPAGLPEAAKRIVAFQQKYCGIS